MGKGAHNNTQMTELVVAASRYQVDMLRKTEFIIKLSFITRLNKTNLARNQKFKEISQSSAESPVTNTKHD